MSSIEPKIKRKETRETKKVDRKRIQKRGTGDRSCYIMNQMRLPFGKSPFFGTHHESVKRTSIVPRVNMPKKI